METVAFNYFDWKAEDGIHIALPKAEFEAFDESLLWVPDSFSNTAAGEKFDALAAIFDLQGFGSFFDVHDPFATVREFVEAFLAWLFATIKSELVKRADGDGVLLWSYLPMFAKFMGDGVLLIWSIPSDQRHGGALAIGNIVALLHTVCIAYREGFWLKVAEGIEGAPEQLRCGGALGEVAAVANRKDYIGPCINIAARIQKLGSLSFAFSRHGLNPNRCFRGEWRQKFAPATARIRGIHRPEPILVDNAEFERLSRRTKNELFVSVATKSGASRYR